MAGNLGVTFAIGAKVAPTVASAFATVENKIRASQSRMRELSEKAKVLSEAQAAKARVAETQKLYAAGGGQDPVLRQALQQQVAAYQKAMQAAKQYGVSVQDLAKIHAQTDRALDATRRRLEALNKAEAYKAKRQEAASSIRIAAVPALALAAPIKEAIEFESAMADAAKTIDGMRDEAGKLTPKYYEMESVIKQMGRDIPLTHAEIAALFAAGGQQGMTGVDDLREFTQMASQMAVAFGMGTEEAADAIGGYRSALNLTMPEARSLLDLMNQYANTTSASEKGIADVVRRIGSLGSVGGIAAKPMTALAATLDSMKVAPEVAATGIKNLILAMTAGSAATKNQKEAFASLGVDTVKLAQQMQTDGPAAIVSVLEAIQKLPKAQQLSTMQKIFGKESLGSIAPLLANLDKVKENLLICGDESKYAGAMQQEFANRNDTTANKLLLLTNQLKEFGITVAANFLPAIQSIAQTIGPAISSVSAFANEHKGLTTAVFAVVGGLTAIKIAVAATTWLVSGVSGAFNLAKAAFAGFSAMSKLAAAGQWALNAAMSANPIGIAVAAIAALVGGMVYLYNTCEPVRAVFDKVFSFIGEKISWAWDKIKAVGGALKAVGKFLGFGGNDEDEDTAKAAETSKASAQQPEAAQAGIAQPQAANNGSASAMPAITMPAIAAPAAAMSAPDLNAFSQASAAQIQSVNPQQPSQQSQQAPDIAEIMRQIQEAAKTQTASNSSTQITDKQQIIQPQVEVAINVTQNGVPEQSFAQGVMNAIKSHQSEIGQIISNLVNEQARLAYGG